MPLSRLLPCPPLSHSNHPQISLPAPGPFLPLHDGTSPTYPHPSQVRAPLSSPNAPQYLYHQPFFYHSTPSCICQSPELQKWLQCLTPTSLLTAPPTRATFNPTLRHFSQDHLRPQPPSLQALGLHPSSLSPSLHAPAPCIPHTPHSPAFPGPWPHLPPDHLTLVSPGCALAPLLAPALPGAAVVPFLPEKGPHGNRNVQRDEKAAAAETAGTEGAPEGGGDPGDNWSLND